jgi:small subunit ribosomal protein S27Ae
MQVFLHQLDGSVAVADLSHFDSLEALLLNFASPDCRIVYQGANLTSLESVQSNANLYVTGDLDGGKKKKKKKVYTTKKKNKHIHKRVKLGIYNLYAIDGKHLVIQAREPSPNREKPAPPAAQAPSWPNTGIGTIADSATPPSRWTQKLLKRTRKS